MTEKDEKSVRSTWHSPNRKTIWEGGIMKLGMRTLRRISGDLDRFSLDSISPWRRRFPVGG